VGALLPFLFCVMRLRRMGGRMIAFNPLRARQAIAPIPPTQRQPENGRGAFQRS